MLNHKDLLLIDQLQATAHDLNLRIGFTNGCFDLLHAGHIESLTIASDMCGILIVGLNSDAWIREHKGPCRPIIPETHRRIMLEALAAVDLVVPFDDEADLAKLIEFIGPQLLFKGEEYRGRLVTGHQQVKHVVYLPMLVGVSTTRIEQKIITARMAERAGMSRAKDVKPANPEGPTDERHPDPADPGPAAA